MRRKRTPEPVEAGYVIQSVKIRLGHAHGPTAMECELFPKSQRVTMRAYLPTGEERMPSASTTVEHFLAELRALYPRDTTPPEHDALGVREPGTGADRRGAVSGEEYSASALWSMPLP